MNSVTASRLRGVPEMLPVVASKESPRGRSPVMVHVRFSAVPRRTGSHVEKEALTSTRLELGWKEKEPAQDRATH